MNPTGVLGMEAPKSVEKRTYTAVPQVDMSIYIARLVWYKCDLSVAFLVNGSGRHVHDTFVNIIVMLAILPYHQACFSMYAGATDPIGVPGVPGYNKATKFLSSLFDQVKPPLHSASHACLRHLSPA